MNTVVYLCNDLHTGISEQRVSYESQVQVQKLDVQKVFQQIPLIQQLPSCEI